MKRSRDSFFFQLLLIIIIQDKIEKENSPMSNLPFHKDCI